MLPEFPLKPPKPVKKTRSMVSITSIIHLSTQFLFTWSHTSPTIASVLMSLLFVFNQYSFHRLFSHISDRPDHVSTLSLTHSGLSIYLVVMWLWHGFLESTDNSRIVQFIFSSHLHPLLATVSVLLLSDQLLINVTTTEQHWLPTAQPCAKRETHLCIFKSVILWLPFFLSESWLSSALE